MKTFLLAWPLMLAIAIAMLMPPPRVERLPPREKSWRAQVAAVRAGKSDTIAVEHAPIGDEQLQDVLGLELLDGLELGRSEVSTAGISSLQPLASFRSLNLRGAPIDDAMFAEICRITTIRRINLENATLTDGGLAAVHEQPQLVQLRLVAPNITDAGLAHIAALPKLRFLHLIDAPITDAGLAHLATMKHLESLYLDNARVTDAGIEKLLKALPELHFHIDQSHHPRDPKRADR